MAKKTKDTILLVEDEALIAFHQKRELELYNYEVKIITSGEEAIKYVKENNNIDLILMDINLGDGIDGTEASQIILNEKDIPIVFLSSHTNPEIVEKTEKITSYGYVVKNTGITVLDASIKMAFKLHEAKMKEKEKENALIENDFYLKKAQEISKIGHFSYDPVTKLLTGSNELFKIFDIDKQKPLFEDFLNTVHPEDDILIFPFIKRAIEKSIPYNVEHRIKHKNGKILYIHAKGEILETNEGKKLIGTVQDITEKKTTQLMLENSEKKYSMLFNKMLDGYALHEIICDKKGKPIDYRFLDINPAFEKLTGLKAKKIIGKTVKEVLPGIESFWIEKYGKVALTGNPCQFNNYTKELNKHYKITAFCPKKGQFACIFHDITKQMQAEEKINIQSKAMDAASIGIVITSIENTITYTNNAFNKIFGYKQNKLIGKSVISLIPENKISIFKNIMKIIKKKEKWKGEILGKRKNKKIIEMMMYGAAVKNENNQLIGFIGIYEDITEKKILEKKIEEFNTQTQKQNDFLTNVINSFHDPFYVINAETYIIEMSNKKAKSEGIVNKKHCYEATHNLDKPCCSPTHPCTLKTIIKTKKPITVEHIHINKKGEKKYIKVNGYPIIINGKVKKIIEFSKDITLQKQIEERLIETNEKYRRLTENSPDMIYRMNLENGEYEFVSDASEKIFGYAPQDWYNNPYLIKNLLPDNWHQYFKEKWKNLINGKIDPTYEYQIIHKDGSIRWINQRNILIKNREGKPTHIEGIVTDITNKKHAEEEIKDLALFPEENDNPVFRISKDARLLYINKPGKKLAGNELVKIGEYIPEKWKKLIEKVWKITKSQNFEIPINGRMIHFYAKPILNKGYINVYAIDITDQKNAEINLKNSEAKYKLLFEQAAVGVAEINSYTGHFITINQKYCDIVGYTREEMLKMDFLEITHPDDLQEDLDNMELLRQGKIKNFKMQKRYYAKDKSVKWVNLLVTPLWIEGEQPNHHVAVVEDITNQKMAEDELKSALNQNKILLKELQHRVKNSFNMISSMITIAITTKKSKEEKSALQDIATRIKAVSVMYDFLYIKKEISETRLDEYLNRLISTIPIASSQIKINIKLEVIIIPVKKAINIGLITIELITNSIKHAFPDGKKGIINLALKKSKSKIIIEITDNGIGINKVTNKSESPSFGLELIDILTKQLNGKIQIKNDKGTKCRLEFDI